MDKEKAIDEMAGILVSACVDQDPCPVGCEKCHAEKLYNAGYRKASDVAKEIFGEIESLMDSYKFFCGGSYDKELGMAVSELKKKYTGEKQNGR